MTNYREQMDSIDTAIRNLRSRKMQVAREYARELDKILEALEVSQIGDNEICLVFEEDTELVIEAEYGFRGERCTREYRIPLKVINAPDPVAAARSLVAANLDAERQEQSRLEVARKAHIIAEYHRLTNTERAQNYSIS